MYVDVLLSRASFLCMAEHGLDQWENMLILNSLLSGKFECNLKYVIFKQILVIDDWGISCGIALK